MKALVLAGGFAQIELIKQLKERNITTVLADGSTSALAKPYADVFYQIQLFDVDAVKELVNNSHALRFTGCQNNGTCARIGKISVYSFYNLL